MSWFHNRRVLSKLMMLVTFMSIIIVLMGTLGIHSLQTLNSKADDMEESAKEALMATSLSAIVMNIEQHEQELVADTSKKNLADIKQQIVTEKASFDEKVTQLRKTADVNQIAALDKITTALTTYLAAQEKVFAVAATLGNSEPSEQVLRMKEAENSDDAQAEALHKVVADYSDDSANNVSKVSDDITAVYHQISKLMTLCLVIGIAAGSLIGFVMAKYGIARPISAVVALLQKLAVDDLDVAIAGVHRKDEVGDIARTAQIFKDNGLEKRRLVAQQQENELRAVEEKRSMMRTLADNFKMSVQGIITTVAAASTELFHTAEGMQKTVADVSTQSVTVSTASEQTSNNVQNVSAAVEEMSASIREIASQVAQSSTLVGETVHKAQQADQTTQALSEAVNQISGILSLIQSIAGQINLLALNATIESARAGEAGKGFAVVASEVKNLATKTTQATEEIAVQIANVQAASKEVVGVLGIIQASVSNVNQYSAGIASAVEEQSAATKEISVNMQSAAQGVQHISDNITAITRGAQDADQASTEVLGAAQELSKQSELLNHQVQIFLEGMAA